MLTLLWPRPARLVLGGRLASVVPYRVRDLAGLEGWAADRLGTPSQGLWAALAIPDAPARHDELRRLYRAQERGAAGFGSPDVAAMLATHEGRAEQLRLSLRERDRRTGRIRRPRIADCRIMAREAADDEWLAWATAAWQAHPLDEIARAIDAEIGATWPAARHRYEEDKTPSDGWAAGAWAIAEATGWTFDQIGRLTLFQYDVCRWRAKHRENCHAVPGALTEGIDPREFQAAVGDRRAAFWAAEDRAMSGLPAIPPRVAAGANGKPFRSSPDLGPPVS